MFCCTYSYKEVTMEVNNKHLDVFVSILVLFHLLSLLSLLFLCFFSVIRPVTTCGLRLQAGHGPFRGGHWQPYHRSNPQPWCQQQIPRHLHHPVHTGHYLSQPSNHSVQLYLSTNGEYVLLDAHWNAICFNKNHLSLKRFKSYCTCLFSTGNPRK